MMNILNGGCHADNTVDFQEFMIMPVGAESFREALRMCAEVYHNLKKICEKDGLSTAVGDEGGFAPDLPDAVAVLDLIMEAVKASGYLPGEDFKIALDAAASELYDEKTGVYHFPGESRLKGEKVMRNTEEMIEYYENLIEKFPIISIEDGLDEEDWDGWQAMTERLGERIQLVGDDLHSAMPTAQSSPTVLVRRKIPLLRIWPWLSMPGRLRRGRPAAQNALPNIISFCALKNSWASWQNIRIHSINSDIRMPKGLAAKGSMDILHEKRLEIWLSMALFVQSVAVALT